jgi:hypothetical protein
MKTEVLIEELKSRGMQLEATPGGLFVVHDRGTLQPELATKLREHKAELLAWLNAQHVAKQILCGEFSGCDKATASNLARVLQTSNHPLANRALEYLLRDV